MTIALGVITVAASLVVIGLAGSIALVLVGVALVAVGKVLVEPTLNVAIASAAAKAGDGLLASYYGFSALSVAFGGAAGQLLGGWLFDESERMGTPALPFIAMGVIGLIVTALLEVFSRGTHGREIDAV